MNRTTLTQVFKQYQKGLSLDNNSTCSHVFSTSIGLPCAHFLKQLVNSGGQLAPEHFHVHWHLKRIIPDCLERPPAGLDELLQNIQDRHQVLLPHQQRLLEDSLGKVLESPTPTVIEPAPIKTRGQPRGALNKNKRIPTASEQYEARINGPKCSICQKVNHNQRTCPYRPTTSTS